MEYNKKCVLGKEEWELEKIVDKIKQEPTIICIGILRDFLNEYKFNITKEGLCKCKTSKEKTNKSKCNTCNTGILKNKPTNTMQNTTRKPNETGIYIHNNNLKVNVFATYKGSCHGSDDYYFIKIETLDGKLVDKFEILDSHIPSYIVGGKPYYIGCG